MCDDLQGLGPLKAGPAGPTPSPQSTMRASMDSMGGLAGPRGSMDMAGPRASMDSMGGLGPLRGSMDGGMGGHTGPRGSMEGMGGLGPLRGSMEGTGPATNLSVNIWLYHLKLWGICRVYLV